MEKSEREEQTRISSETDGRKSRAKPHEYSKRFVSCLFFGMGSRTLATGCLAWLSFSIVPLGNAASYATTADADSTDCIAATLSADPPILVTARPKYGGGSVRSKIKSVPRLLWPLDLSLLPPGRGSQPAHLRLTYRTERQENQQRYCRERAG